MARYNDLKSKKWYEIWLNEKWDDGKKPEMLAKVQSKGLAWATYKAFVQFYGESALDIR